MVTESGSWKVLVSLWCSWTWQSLCYQALAILLEDQRPQSSAVQGGTMINQPPQLALQLTTDT